MRLVWPVPYYYDGRPPRVSSGFRGSRPGHDGIDVMFQRRASDRGTLHHQLSPNYYMPDGFPAVAMADGVVTFAQRVSKGDYVRIDHGGGLESHSMHMRNLGVRAGDRVRAGERIGTISHAPEGYTLNHLHFGVKENGRWVDPERILAGAAVVRAPLPLWAKVAFGVGGLWAARELLRGAQTG